MSEEKKLSKNVLSRWLDNLRDFAIRMLEEHPAKEDEPWSKGDDEAVEQLKSRIESSAQEPRQTYGIIEELDGVKPPKEPSEAEVEEFVKEWNSTLLAGYKLENVHGKKDYTFALKVMLKEYDKLRRG